MMTYYLFSTAIIKPQISVRPRFQTVDFKRAAYFECSATGFPAPELSWYRKRSQESNNRYAFTSKGSLYIPVAETEDEGEYICSAQNTGGVSTMTAVLYVRGKYFI